MCGDEISISSECNIVSGSSFTRALNDSDHAQNEADEEEPLPFWLHILVPYYRSEVHVQKSLVLSRDHGS